MTADQRDPQTSGTGRQGGWVRHLVVNGLSSQVDRIVDVISFLVLVPYVLHAVGTDQYGLWTLVWSIVSLFSLVDLGFSNSVVKYVADARGREDPDRLKRVVCTLFWVFVGQAVVLMLVVGVFDVVFARLFGLSEAIRDVAKVVFLVVGAGFALKLPFAMFRGVLVGYQKMWVANTYKVIATLVYLVSVLLVLPLWPDLRLFAVLNLIVTLGPAVAMAVHVWSSLPNITIHPRFFERKLLRQIWSFSFFFTIIQLSALIATRVDSIVIKTALPLSAVAVYGIAMRVSSQAYLFCVQITRAVTPVVAELHAAGEHERLRKLWLTGSKIAVAFAAPFMIGCTVLAYPLITAWVGKEYIMAAPLLQLMAIGAMSSIAHANSYEQLAMRGDEKILAFGMMGGQVANLGLSLALVHVWGLYGVALASLSGPLIVDLGVVQRRLKHNYGVGYWAFYRSTLLPSLLPTTVLVGLLWSWQLLRPEMGLFEIAGAEALATVVFWSLFWKIGLDDGERAYVLRKIAERRAVRMKRRGQTVAREHSTQDAE